MFSSLNSSFIHRVETIIIDGENPTKLRIDNKNIIKKIWNLNETMIYELHVRLPKPPDGLDDTEKYYLANIRHGDNVEEIISRNLSRAYPIYRKESNLFDQYTIVYHRRSPDTPFAEYMFLKPKEKNNVIIKCARGDEVNRLCDLLYQTYPQKLLVSIMIPREEIDIYQHVIEIANENIANWLVLAQ
jgi:hypothetical protein